VRISAQHGLVATAVTLVAALAYPFIAPPCPVTYCPTPNEFGDWLAGVAQPIALAWLVAGFWLQRQELALQRQELAETRAELARQADAASSSDLTAKRTAFIGLRSEYQALMDDALTPLKQVLQKIPHLWPGGESILVSKVAGALYKALSNAQNAEYRAAEIQAYLHSNEFKGVRAQYSAAMEGLLDLAAACGPDEVLLNRVRSTPQFAFYRLLARWFPDIGVHKHGIGTRSTDCEFGNMSKLEI
jgi:hypothetical protein